MKASLKIAMAMFPNSINLIRGCERTLRNKQCYKIKGNLATTYRRSFHHKPRFLACKKTLPTVESPIEPFKMKIDSPQFHAMFTPEVNNLVRVFERHGYELRIAGGAVRDLLMHKQPQDIDFATTANPQQMKELFTKEGIRMFNVRGLPHGTVSIRINDKENFQVTTLRIDCVEDGKRTHFEFTTDWHLDASRRDLTVNSMFLGFDGTVYDYFNGIADLDKRKIRFVENAVARIQSDYLRILRYFRFYGVVCEEPNNHDPETLKAISANASGLSGVSGERVWSELKKVLSGNFKHELFRTIIQADLATHLGLPASSNVKELDVLFERAGVLDLNPITILSALLKDADEMKELNDRLKFSNYDNDLGYFLLMHRDDKLSEDPLYSYQRLLVECATNQRHRKEWIEQVISFRGDVELLAHFKEWQAPKFPVTNNQLLSRDISLGHRFNHILTALRKRWIDSSFTLSDEQLLENFDEIVQEVDQQYPPTPSKKKNRKRKTSQ